MMKTSEAMRLSKRTKSHVNLLSLLLYALVVAISSFFSPVVVSGFATLPSSKLPRARSFAARARAPSKQLIAPSFVGSTAASNLGSVAFPSTKMAAFNTISFSDATNTFLQSMNNSGGLEISNILFAGAILLAVGAFAYANIVYTPEIVENARLIQKEDDMVKVLSLVQEYQMKGSNIGELRDPLEKVLGMTIEEYVSKVDGGDSANDIVVNKQLANALRPICATQK